MKLAALVRSAAQPAMRPDAGAGNLIQGNGMRLLLAILLLSMAGCAESHPRQYAVRLEIDAGGPRGTCSGTAVGRNILLTATHCFGPSRRIVTVNGKPAHALEMVEDGKDHTLIRVSVEFKTWARVVPGFYQGQKLRWIGNPAGLSDMYREGYVSSVKENAAYIFADAFFGDSGSGLMDDRGYIVGVLSGAQAWSSGGLRFQVVGAFPLAFTDKHWLEIRS